jgi:hypothetical protein
VLTRAVPEIRRAGHQPGSGAPSSFRVYPSQRPVRPWTAWPRITRPSPPRAPPLQQRSGGTAGTCAAWSLHDRRAQCTTQPAIVHATSAAVAEVPCSARTGRGRVLCEVPVRTVHVDHTSLVTTACPAARTSGCASLLSISPPRLCAHGREVHFSSPAHGTIVLYGALIAFLSPHSSNYPNMVDGAYCTRVQYPGTRMSTVFCVEPRTPCPD